MNINLALLLLDYSPGGMLMPDRYSSINVYRYGFNGMEKDNEIKGEGNSYTTEFRQYDSRVARWLSTDPVTHDQYSPYSAFDNNPIYFSDPSGADAETVDPTGIYNTNDEGLIKSFEIWASTDAGRDFILDHAEKGFELKGTYMKDLYIVAKKNGKYHKKKVDLEFKGDPGNGAANAGVTFKGGRMMITISVEDMLPSGIGNEYHVGFNYHTPFDFLAGVELFAHEAFYHGDRYRKLFVKGLLNKETWSYYKAVEINHSRGVLTSWFYNHSGIESLKQARDIIYGMDAQSNFFQTDHQPQLGFISINGIGYTQEQLTTALGTKTINEIYAIMMNDMRNEARAKLSGSLANPPSDDVLNGMLTGGFVKWETQNK